jgi:hypothetical protein
MCVCSTDDGFDMWTLFTLPKPTLGVYRMLPNQTFLHLPQLGTTKPMVLTPDEVNKLSSESHNPAVPALMGCVSC